MGQNFSTINKGKKKDLPSWLHLIFFFCLSNKRKRFLLIECNISTISVGMFPEISKLGWVAQTEETHSFSWLHSTDKSQPFYQSGILHTSFCCSQIIRFQVLFLSETMMMHFLVFNIFLSTLQKWLIFSSKDILYLQHTENASEPVFSVVFCHFVISA